MGNKILKVVKLIHAERLNTLYASSIAGQKHSFRSISRMLYLELARRDAALRAELERVPIAYSSSGSVVLVILNKFSAFFGAFFCEMRMRFHTMI